MIPYSHFSVHSPTGGQGLNTCVQDAVSVPSALSHPAVESLSLQLNLGWKLSLVYKGLSAPTLLDSYDSERLPVIAEMLNITTGMLNLLHGPAGIEDAMHRGQKLNMLGVNYRLSSIVIDEVTKAEPVSAYRILDESTLVAGDRAPDAPGLSVVKAGAETRFFDLFKATHHTVLVFGPDVGSTEDIIGALSSYSRDIIRIVVVLPQDAVATESSTVTSRADVVVDSAGHAYRAYLTEKGEKRVVVVRPDGVAGAIVCGAEGMKAYVKKIFV
jgi:hypothetical protein